MLRLLSYLYTLLYLSINVSIAQKEVSVNELSELNGKMYYSTIPFTGEASEYYDNGNKKEMRTYKEGLLNGQSLFYYPNSFLNKKIFYSNNKKEGKHYSYYKTGEKESVGNYKSDKKRVSGNGGMKMGNCEWKALLSLINIMVSVMFILKMVHF